MPVSFLYLGIMLAVICLWFMLLKRPIYESIFVSFVVLLFATGTWKNVGAYINEAFSTSLLYSMTVFTAMSIVLTKTKIIDGAVSIILALLGRVTGGAGYVAVLASSFIGALSGSGPGNVMATGPITIPAMIKSGFPKELAGNITSSSSYLGNMIPPSANIVAALGAYTALYPNAGMTDSQFWIVCWGCSLWFILQRLLTVYAFCKFYKVKPLSKQELPTVKQAIKTGWQGLLLPVIILVPFVLDYFLKETFFTARLGTDGAKYFSKSLLYFIAGAATFFALIVCKNKKEVTPWTMAKLFAEKTKSICPTVGACIFGYMVGSMFVDLNVSADLESFVASLNMSRLGLSLFIPLFCCFITMIIPGSSVVVLFGPVFIGLFASVGADPIMVAAMLHLRCYVRHHAAFGSWYVRRHDPVRCRVRQNCQKRSLVGRFAVHSGSGHSHGLASHSWSVRRSI